MNKTTSGLLVIEKLADIRIVLFADSSVLDQANIERIKDELLALVEQEASPKFIISFENVKHLSSAVLGMLMAVHKAVARKGGNMYLASINPQLMEVFKLTRLDKVFKIYPDVDKAIKKF